MSIIYLRNLAIIGLCLISFQVWSQKYEQKPPEKTRILFLLDASGSMYAKMDDRLRIDVAKLLLSDLVDSLRSNQNLELALRVYGHQYHRRYNNCQDSKLEVSFARNNHDRTIQVIRVIQPNGTTPIAYSLEQAANDFPKQSDGYRNVLILITDGLESCGGDPCAVSQALQKKGIFLKPFVVGLGLDKNYLDDFACMGQYFDADNIPDFKSALSAALNQTLKKTTVSVELLNSQNQAVVTDLNVTFINQVTGESVYDFIHYRDPQGRPDTVEIDAVLSYDLMVSTVPPVMKRNVPLKGGVHNVLKVMAPEGALQVNQAGSSEYPEKVKILVKRPGKDEILEIQNIGEEKKYLQGKYDLEITTLPRLYIKEASLSEKDPKRINIPGPGIVNIVSSARGIGVIYQVQDDGRQEWVVNLDPQQSRSTLALQPGKYKLVFRGLRSKGSKYTEVKEFQVKTGSTSNLRLY